MIKFSKYHGTGNDFILIDDMDRKISLHENQIAKLCHRQFGIGADGLIMVRPGANDYTMDYFNADGAPGSMCGNGARCAYHFTRSLGHVDDLAQFSAVDGEYQARQLENGWIGVSLRDVQQVSKDERAFCIDTGSPHYIEFVDRLEDCDVFNRGQSVRYSETYREEGINVNFVERTENGLKVATYERGVENVTLSCGTGVTASALAYAILLNVDRGPVGIETSGGPLIVDFERVADGFVSIELRGPVTKVFEGTLRDL